MPKPTDIRLKIAAAAILSIVVLVVWLYIVNESRKTILVNANRKMESQSDTTAKADSNKVVAPPTRPTAPAPVENWHYSNSEDSMTGKPEKSASVVSANSVAFDFPYAGAQHATLILRIHPRYGKDVILNIEKGHFLCSFTGCGVSVRFDDKPPRRFSATEPEDHSTTTLFIGNYNSFVSEAKKAQTIRIEALFYSQGSRVFEFDVAGLQWQ